MGRAYRGKPVLQGKASQAGRQAGSKRAIRQAASGRAGRSGSKARKLHAHMNHTQGCQIRGYTCREGRRSTHSLPEGWSTLQADKPSSN